MQRPEISRSHRATIGRAVKLADLENENGYAKFGGWWSVSGRRVMRSAVCCMLGSCYNAHYVNAI